MTESRKSDAVYPALPMQEGMLFHSTSDPHSGQYIAQVVSKLGCDTDISTLQKAWDAVIERHPALRAGFRWEEGRGLLQHLRDDVRVPTEVQDWSKLSEDAAQQALREFLRDDSKKEFDIANAPLMRFHFAILPGNDRLFIWTHHHALIDGRARVIVLREVSHFYEVFRRGQTPELQAPPAYKDYVEWFHQQDWTAAKHYWQQRLAGFTSGISISSLFAARTANALERSREQEVDISPRLEAGLQKVAKEYKVTVNIVVQAAWTVLLSRYSGQEDVVFGETRACRRLHFESASSMVGLLMNTVPIRMNANPSLPFSHLLQALREQHVALREYEHSPLAGIREWTGISGMTELFDSIVVFEEYELDSALRHAGCALWHNGIRRSAPAHYPVALTGYNKPDLQLQIVHDPAKIEDAIAQRMAGHLRTLLESAAENPEEIIVKVSILDAQERRRVLQEWNDTAIAFPRQGCVHDLFEEQVLRTPETVAVAHEERELTYTELNERANQLANYLRDSGVKPDTRVAICMERGLEMMVAVLAVLKAGGAYVPLDPGYPAERLSYMLEDSAPTVLLTKGQSMIKARDGLMTIDLGAEAAPWARYPRTNPDRESVGLGPHHLAYVIYTSGSTGIPKGVAIEHRNTVNFLHWARSSFSHEILRNTLFSTSLSFDLAVYECLLPIIVGARVQIVGNLLDVAQSVADVTLINTVPSVINALIEASGVPKTVRTINLAGEPLKRALIERIFSTTNASSICNLYGPSETTTYSTWMELKRGADIAEHIGRPIANTQVYILDGQLEPVPVGVIGELYTGGAGVARGYLNRPELTAERFLTDPFAGQAGARMYKTGDLGRWQPDGTIEFLGRNDLQVKIRGCRIELGEIEARLAECDSIGDTAVIVREDAPGDKRLVAYYTCAGNTGQPVVDSEPGRLRSQLAAKLPEYMVPVIYVRLESLPLSENGKLDRRALPAPAGAHQGTEYRAPQTAAERLLCKIWEEVLHVQNVGLQSDFFELGGHSLKAMQVIARVRDAFGIDLGVKAVFKHRILVDMARAIEEVSPVQQLHQPPLVAHPENADLPLSYNEEVLWMVAQAFSSVLSFNSQMGARLRGQLDKAALQSSFDDIVQRHEALRTTFSVSNGRPVRVIHDKISIPVKETDLRNMPESSRHGKAVELADEEVKLPFDFATGPLMRINLIRLADEEHVLLITVHHIISDGWSLGLLARELQVIYCTYVEKGRLSLPPISLQYADYAIWKRSWLQEDAIKALLAYWITRLSVVSDLGRLQPDLPQGAPAGHRQANLYFILNEHLTGELRAFSQRKGVTLFMALLTAFNSLLHSLTGAKDIVVAVPVSERVRSELENMMGLFVNIVALHTDFRNDPTFFELLNRIGQTTQDAYAHQDLPFGILEQTLGHNQLSRIMFDFINVPNFDIHLPGLQAERLSARADNPFGLDLILFATKRSKSIEFGLAYNANMFSARWADRLAKNLIWLIEKLLESDSYGMNHYSAIVRDDDWLSGQNQELVKAGYVAS